MGNCFALNPVQLATRTMSHVMVRVLADANAEICEPPGTEELHALIASKSVLTLSFSPKIDPGIDRRQDH